MDKRLTVLLHENGTVQVIPDDATTNQHRWVSGVFLILGFCFGGGLGLFTLFGLRTKTCSRALIGLQMAALLNCIQGQVLGAIFIVSKPNSFFCRLSACMSTTFLVIQTVEITLLTFLHQNFLVDMVPWVIGFIVALNVATDTQQIHVHFFPSR